MKFGYVVLSPTPVLVGQDKTKALGTPVDSEVIDNYRAASRVPETFTPRRQSGAGGPVEDRTEVTSKETIDVTPSSVVDAPRSRPLQSLRDLGGDEEDAEFEED